MQLFQIKIQKFCVVSNSFRYFSEAFSTLKKEKPKLKIEYKQLEIPTDILSTKILKPYYDDIRKTKYFASLFLLLKTRQNMKSGFLYKTSGFDFKKTPNSSFVKTVVNTNLKNPCSKSNKSKNKQGTAFSHLISFSKPSSLYSKEIPIIEPPKKPVIPKVKILTLKKGKKVKLFADFFFTRSKKKNSYIKEQSQKKLIKPKKKRYLLKLKRGLLNNKHKFHLGHTNLKLKRSWNNYLNNFYLGNRNNTTIFRRQFTYMHMAKAIHIFTRIVSEKKNTILIINTNPELSKLMIHMQKTIKNKNVWFSDCGWTKGTLTNSDKVFTTIQTFIDFYYNYDNFINTNTIHFPIYKKLKKNYKGFVVNKQSDTLKEFQNQKPLVHLNLSQRFSANLKTEKDRSFDFYKKNTLSRFTQDWKPDLILFMSNNAIESILTEAEKRTIPTIAFIDSNHKNSSQNITYPIPGNTNSYMLIWFFFNLISQILRKKILKSAKKNA